MSYYKDFLQELPERSLKLLDRYYESEKKQFNSNEVTLLISIAMPVFVITSELITSGKKEKESKGAEMMKILNEPKNNNVILKNISKNWLHCLDYTSKPLLEIEQLINPIPAINSKQTAISILRQIRNALSHGEIKFTEGKNNEIAQIFFRSEKRNENGIEGYFLNLIPVDDFKLLLENWCKFLRNHDIVSCLNAISHAA
jgi:hypothetical protein